MALQSFLLCSLFLLFCPFCSQKQFIDTSTDRARYFVSSFSFFILQAKANKVLTTSVLFDVQFSRFGFRQDKAEFCSNSAIRVFVWLSSICTTCLKTHEMSSGRFLLLQDRVKGRSRRTQRLIQRRGIGHSSFIFTAA